MRRRERHINPTAHLVLGLMLMLWGALFTLDNLHLLRARDYVRWWPAALVAFGLVHLAQARRFGGAIWVLVGSLLLANNLGYLHMDIRNFWPLILVLVGGRMIGQAFYRGGSGGGASGPAGGPGAPGDGGFRASAADSGSVISVVTVMGRVDRRITSHEFQRGEITAFMGGCRLDLRDATPAGGQAIINVVAMMGGCEILIPPTWHVVNELTPLMGGVDEKRRGAVGPADAPRLILRGFVVMGGVEIKD